MFKATQHCQVCKKIAWAPIDTLYSGIWNKEQKEITRLEINFPIGECEHCGHVQVTSVYDDYIFSCLYFSDVRTPSMFFLPKKNEKTAYDQMIDFFKEHITDISNIVDFGCGSGNIFKEIKKHQISTGALTGIDYHPMIEDETVNTMLWDLNSLDNIPNKFWYGGIDLAISTHVLEHVIDPVTFLSCIANNLSSMGKIFIEVPDCSPDTDLSNLAFTSVVHGQHIHYYTKDSLANIAQQAGLKIIKTRQIMTKSIPRMLVLMEKTSKLSANKKTLITAANAVKLQLTQVTLQHQLLAKKIIHEIDKNGIAGLWGIGGDAFLLFKNTPQLISLIQEKKLILFDYELSNHSYLGQPIYSSNKLADIKFAVFITPLPAITREKMAIMCAHWTSKVIDVYKLESI